jgi:signal transduction histidine kinase
MIKAALPIRFRRFPRGFHVRGFHRLCEVVTTQHFAGSTSAVLNSLQPGATRTHIHSSDGPTSTSTDPHWESNAAVKKRVLLIEDDRVIRESLAGLLEEEGYEVSSAENGQDALRRLRTETSPDVIVLDLRMPVMDGWEFRAIQKDDPELGRIPVVAISADRSPQAVTISAQAYLRKPLDVDELLRTIERILHEQVRREMADRLEQAERLASLGRVAAGVGHEINNPLTFVLLNLSQALKKLRPLGGLPSRSPQQALLEPENIEATRVLGIVEMLDDCQVGLERIRQTVGNLQRLSRKADEDRTPLDVRKIIDQSIAIAWNQIRHRARLIRDFGEIPPIQGNAASLGQVFLNLLVNAAQAIPEGNASRNQIVVSTKLERGNIVVEIRDTGRGIAPEVLPHVFEPFFTTKPMGVGTGLGLSISRQTVADHGGHMDIQSEPDRGSVLRVFLPAAEQVPGVPETTFATIDHQDSTQSRKRVLVIDDEPLIGSVIRAALADEHDVFVAHKASDALARLEAGESFDLVLCDVVMPDIGGPEVYATIAERWPQLVDRLVFMTGGAFTPATAEFIDRALTPVLPKPFRLDELTRLVRERVPNHD